MKTITRAAASLTLPLMMLTETCFAQNYPHYPYDYRPGTAGIMGIGPGGREAYHPDYYSAAPGYHYGFGMYGGYGGGPAYYPPNIVGLPSQPTASPDAPYAYSYRSFRRLIPPSQANAAAIDIKLPPGAKLWFQGQLTQQKGSYRFFESPALKPGQAFAYQIKALWTDEKGEKVERKRTLRIHAGDHVILDLRKPAS